VHPYVSNAETEHFRHVEFKLPELGRMALDNSAEYQAAAAAYYDDRWSKIRRSYVTKTPIPAGVQDEAEKYSRELVFSLNTFRSRIVRGQSHGSLDSSKLSRLASPGMSAREFDRLAATAYRRREHVQSTTMRPRIAIVGDMCEQARTAGTIYLKTLGRLAYTVAEAAKLAGVDVALYGSRGQADEKAHKMCRYLGMTDQAKAPHVVVTLKDWDTDISGADYAVFTDSVPGCGMSFPVTLFQGMHLVLGRADGMGSKSGAGGVEFARAQGANIVIGFGTFSRHETPDILFAPNASVDDVVRGIVSKLCN
jgi:hypothetical protein